MIYLVSLFLVIATPTLGQYQLSDGGYGYQDPIGSSGFHNNFDEYGSQFPGGNRGSHNRGGYPGPLSPGNGPFGHDPIGSRPPGMPGRGVFPSRGSNYDHQNRYGRYDSSEDNSIPDSDSEYDSSQDQERGRPGRRGSNTDRHGVRRGNYRDAHNRGWEFENPNPFDRKDSRRNNGRRRDSYSSSEESSASSRSSDSRSSSEENNPRRRYDRNRNLGADLGSGLIPLPGFDLKNVEELFDRTARAGRGFLDESRNQLDKMGNRISDSVKQNGQNIGETLTKGVNDATTQLGNVAGNIPSALGQNGTALTLGSFKQPQFVKQFLENIYNAMKSWGQVLKGLPRNIWSRFENMINCMNGNCPE